MRSVKAILLKLAVVVALLVVSCIENDIPYPIIVAEQNGRSWSAFRKI